MQSGVVVNSQCRRQIVGLGMHLMRGRGEDVGESGKGGAVRGKRGGAGGHGRGYRGIGRKIRRQCKMLGF